MHRARIKNWVSEGARRIIRSFHVDDFNPTASKPRQKHRLIEIDGGPLPKRDFITTHVNIRFSQKRHPTIRSPTTNFPSPNGRPSDF